MQVEAFGHTFEMVNEDKAERALHGTMGPQGTPKGGVGDQAAPEALLAEYDRLGGLIRLNGDQVKMGCFYNFPGKKPAEEPVVLLQFNINGKVVEVPADEPLPMLVRAAKMAEAGEEMSDEEKQEGEEKEEQAAPASKSTTLIGSKATKKATKKAAK